MSILTVISRPSQPKRLLRRSRLGDTFDRLSVAVLSESKGGDGTDCDALRPFGPVIKLEDVVEACGSG